MVDPAQIEYPTSADLADLRRLSIEKQFSPGDVLRKKGEHYSDMFLIIEGEVDVDLEPLNSSSEPVIVHPISPIGEICFLRGTAANATVTSRAATRALFLDHETLARIEVTRPDLAVWLLQTFAKTAEDRTSFNLTMTAGAGITAKRPDVEVLLCRDADMLAEAQRLRYDVYCRELERDSPNADHDKGILIDDLDVFGHVFIAVENGETIGTIRANSSTEGSLGILDSLYGMSNSPHHPGATGICTKFAVKRSKRGGPAAMRLISSVIQLGLRLHIMECYIDCIPNLLHYYRAMGFKVAGDAFFHVENGPSIPMKLDLAKHGKKLSGMAGAGVALQIYLKAKTIKFVDRARNGFGLVNEYRVGGEHP